MNGSLACYLINHGIVVAGNTIDKAVVSAINLERASQVQLLAAASGQSFRWTSDEEIAGKREKIFGEGMLRNVWNYYCRRIGPL
jgi:L-fuculose-phosphate aldolase